MFERERARSRGSIGSAFFLLSLDLKTPAFRHEREARHCVSRRQRIEDALSAQESARRGSMHAGVAQKESARRTLCAAAFALARGQRFVSPTRIERVWASQRRRVRPVQVPLSSTNVPRRPGAARGATAAMREEARAAANDIFFSTEERKRRSKLRVSTKGEKNEPALFSRFEEEEKRLQQNKGKESYRFVFRPSRARRRGCSSKLARWRPAHLRRRRSFFHLHLLRQRRRPARRRARRRRGAASPS